MSRQKASWVSCLPDFRRDALRPVSLAVSLLSIACNGNAESETGNRAASRRFESIAVGSGSVPALPEKKESPPADTSKSTPVPACPSHEFKAFLQAYANSGDLQAAYTSESSRHKYPYYWRHNTEPGDPARPKWVTDADRSVGRVKYRYDPETRKFIWVGKRLKAGQTWKSAREDETPVSFAQLLDFKIRRVSADRYDVHSDRGEIDTYELKSGCWQFTQYLEFDRIMSCRWPDQCRVCREWEGGDDKGNLCGDMWW
ncbi:hypothetical protein [Lysobacter sp. 1R34A]|uniref:hypothetical protein n=1 Tax=Lysobacter sp. 1R34A TaxID=3445786 RepID=UPI003EEA48B3